MKKILSIILALVLVFALCAMPASAETNAKEWARGTGPAKIDFSDDGAKISLDAGVNLYYYQKQVTIRDFTVKFKVNAPDYTDQGCYAALTIGGDGKYTGAQGAQAFIVMWIHGDHLCIVPQILHRGNGGINGGIKGDYKFFLDMATEDVVVHGEKVDDITYRLTFNETQVYEFEIPENFNFVEDRNGEGALGFGGSIGMAQSESSTFGDWNILVKEINGVKMNGKDEPVSSDTSTGGTTGGTTGGSDTGSDSTLNPGIIGGDTTTDTTTEEKDNTLLIVIIICGAVLLLAAIAAVIVIVLVKSKKAAAPVEEATEEAEETTEE